MVFSDRLRGRGSFCVPKLVLSSIVLTLFLVVEPLYGQPNYYFKASAPAVKSLPRIGRRSDDSTLAEVPTGIVEMWQPENSPAFDSAYSSSNGGGLRSQSSFAPLSSSQNSPLHRAILWRKLMGEGGGSSFDEFVDNIYHNKS